MFETLEKRELFNRDLFIGTATLDGGIVQGETSLVSVPIFNSGPLQVTQPFFVEAKPVHTDFYDADNLVLFKTHVDNDILVYPAQFDFTSTIDVPEPLAAGRWSVV